MANVHYKAKVRGGLLLELPEEARELKLQPGQEVEIELPSVDSKSDLPDFTAQEAEKNATLAQFAEWEREDAHKTAEQVAEEDQLWKAFEEGINSTRKAHGMRTL